MVYGEYQEEARIPPPEIAEFSIPRELPRQATSVRKVDENNISVPKSLNTTVTGQYYYDWKCGCSVTDRF